MRLNKATVLVVLCSLGSIGALGIQAQSLDCNSPTSVAPDGRTLSGSIPAVTTFWFSVAARGASSYAAEANYPTAADSAFPGLNAFAPTDVQPSCSGSSTLSPRNIMQFDPVIPNGNRVSITAGSAMTILVSVTNSTMQARDFTVRVAETTLFNPLWSTFGGFETFYRLQNTTRDSLTVTLRLINDAGTTVATHNQPLAANATAPTIFTGPGPAPGLGVPDNQAGQAILTHDGPPGALQVDGFLGLFTATPVVLPIKIVPAREGVSVSRLQPSGGGDITAVNTAAGTGLEGGAMSGDVNLTLLTSCVSGQLLKFTSGAWGCADDVSGGTNPGDITSVNTLAGSGLTGGATSGDVNLAANFTGAGGDNGAATTVARGDHIHDGRYFTETELSAAGVINTGGNPVDWTKLKGVPAGFADGVDANSGGTVTSVGAGDASITIGGTATVPTVRVSDLGVTTAKLVDGSVTPAKLSFTPGTVFSVGSGTGLTGGPISTSGTLSVVAPLMVRTITYLAGCDNCSLLANEDGQHAFYVNLIGSMTFNSVTCFSDAGTPTINLQRDDGSAANILSSDLSCSTSGTTTMVFLGPETTLNLNDKLDFVMVAAGGTARRVTVVIKATLN